MEVASAGSAQGGSSNSSDFVRKLYKMLEDPSYKDIVRWNDTGDSFIVLETNQFTKNILPRHFKHSNFASFVRQLNKYDFHKVRNSDESGGAQYGEGAWEFQHPCFQINNKDQLDNIKRKAPAPKKPPQTNDESGAHQMDDINSRLHLMAGAQEDVHRKFEMLNNTNQATIHEVLGLSHRMDQIDACIKELINHLLAGRFPPPGSALETFQNRQRSHLAAVPEHDTTDMAPSGPANTPLQQAQKSFVRMANENTGLKQRQDTVTPIPHMPQGPEPPFGQSIPNAQSLHVPYNTQGETEPVYGLESGNHVIDPSTIAPFQGSSQFTYSNLGAGDLSTAFRTQPRPGYGTRRRSSGLAPNWSRKPNVLLVEDDTMCRRIGQKFLSAANCDSETAADGLAAVQKCQGRMPYDLILMDIMMPRLDGVSACEIIRRENPDIKNPPIISMTSNIRTDDVNKYFDCGMIDILPKPFSKDGLLAKLQQHLPHLLKKNESPPESDPTTTTYSGGNKMPTSDQQQHQHQHHHHHQIAPQPGLHPQPQSNLPQSFMDPMGQQDSKAGINMYGDQGTTTNDEDDDGGTGRSGETPDTSVGISNIGSTGMAGPGPDDYAYMSGYPMESTGPGGNEILTNFGGSLPNNSRRPLSDVDDFSDRKRTRY